MSRSKCILCRCEDVTLTDFRAAFGEGFSEFESLKRYTGLGTGFCQGKGCLVEAALELSRLRGVEPGDISAPTIRPPAEPLTFLELAALEVGPHPSPTGEPAPETDPAAEQEGP